MTLFQQIKMYATEDIASIIKSASKQSGVNFKLISLKLDSDAVNTEIRARSKETPIQVVATVAGDRTEFKFTWTYYVDNEDIYIEFEPSVLAQKLCNKYSEIINSVSASSILKGKQRIVAADGDFDEISDDELPDDDSFSDSLDDLSDQVEDIQDKVDDIDEDDVNIDTDNNISNHYIAECDTCHGVFISAMVESDQKVEKISGVCPLCEKETDQYLRWIVKDVNNEDAI